MAATTQVRLLVWTSLASICLARPVQMDTLGIEPRAFRMRSGCDTTTPCALIGPVCALCSCGRGSVARAPRVAFWEGVVRRRGGRAARAVLTPAIAQLAEHLTVDACSNQMVPGSIPGGRIHCGTRFAGCTALRAPGALLLHFSCAPCACPAVARPFVCVQVPVAWLRACGCAGVETPPAGLEPAIFGLEVRRLVH